MPNGVLSSDPQNPGSNPKPNFPPNQRPKLPDQAVRDKYKKRLLRNVLLVAPEIHFPEEYNVIKIKSRCLIPIIESDDSLDINEEDQVTFELSTVDLDGLKLIVAVNVQRANPSE